MRPIGAAPEPSARLGKSGVVIAGRYRLLRRLGAGGMGEVYEAEHTEIPRRFAIKLLRSELAGDHQMQARFRREAQAAAQLSSDHIVEVSDFGQADDGSPFLVMDLLRGEDLRRMLNRHGRLAPGQAAAIVSQACTGVAAAHEAGVIHRDLKPENLFLAQHGARVTVKVLDFGIAKLRNQSLGTSGGRLLGTPAYMPAEQVRCEDVDERVDVYALGVILYEALTGRLPHPGAAQHQIISHALFEPAVPIRDIDPEIPVELAEIVHGALASSPAERTNSVAELAASLAPFASDVEPTVVAQDEDRSSQPTQPAWSSEPAPSGPGEAVSKPPAAPVAAPPARATRKLRRVAFVLASLCIALAVVWALGRQAPARSEPQLASRKLAQERPRPVQQPPAAPEPRIEPPATLAKELHEPASQPESAKDVARSAPQRAVLDRPSPPRRRAPAPPQAPQEEVNPTPASAASQLIEVRRGERTIVFKRDNPFRK